MTINYIIVEIDKAYNNEEGGVVVNNTIESVAHINREATVVDAPDFTILKKGDKIIAHHNMFRLRNGIGGKLVQSNYHLEDNKYFIPLTEVFIAEEWLAKLQESAINNENMFDVLMEAAKVCSLGQITSALFEVGGQYRRNM